MTTLREAAQQALEDICGAKLCEINSMSSRHEMLRLMDSAITALRAALAEPVAWTDADADAARLALELECLLLDTKDTAALSRWWDSAHEALELHRRRLDVIKAAEGNT